MTTPTELLSSLRADLRARYRSPIWGTAVVALAIAHWKIIAYLSVESHKSADVIPFIQQNVSFSSVIASLGYAVAYVVIFPWVEFVIEWLAGYGRRRRNAFQAFEREKEIGRRKVIAQQNEKALELQLKNLGKESRLADIQLVKDYQAILAGENFSRWLVDLRNGPINSNLNNTIVSYMHKVDSAEGEFIDTEVQNAHREFVGDLSTLLSALNDNRAMSAVEQNVQLIEFSKKAQSSQRAYRELARQRLGV